MRGFKSDDDESLDLFLDTICNVFGGIIFIAMLIAILTDSESQIFRDETREASEYIEEASQAIDPESIKAQNASLILSIESMQDVLLDLGGSDIKDSAKAFRSLKDARDEALARTKSLQSWIDEFDENTQSQAIEVEEKLNKEKARVGTLQKKLDELVDASRIDARLAISQRTNKSQLMFAIKGGRLYWLPVGKTYNRYALDFQDHVDLKNSSEGIVIDPEPGKGVPINQDIENSPVFRAILAKSNPRMDFFDLCIWADSVKEARIFKNLVIKKGYEHNLFTLDAESQLILSPTNQVESQ